MTLAEALRIADAMASPKGYAGPIAEINEVVATLARHVPREGREQVVRQGGADDREVLRRDDAEDRIRRLLPGHHVRVVWTTSGGVGDVLVDGDSAPPETMARVAALPGVVVAEVEL